MATHTSRRPAGRRAAARRSAGRPAGARAARKRIWLFDEGNATMRDLLGGKGAGLAEMSRVGAPEEAARRNVHEGIKKLRREMR